MKTVLSVLFMVTAVLSLHADNKDFTPWWISNHGDYAKTEGRTDNRVSSAFAVFERVKNVADKVASRTPRLVIINTRHGHGAVALPDGGIIINRKTLDICYSGVDGQKGDIQMAFILGHELAHLGNNDFMHLEAFEALETFGSEKAVNDIKPNFKLPDAEQDKEDKKKEWMADRMGALYASMAGYDIRGLFGKENDFLSLWEGMAGKTNIAVPGRKHPSFEERLEFVRAQLLDVERQLELFEAGVLLYQKGNYNDGVAAFREFSKAYPSREVFNNIGACYFNLALERLHYLDERVYYRFRISAGIDYVTRAASNIDTRGYENYLRDEEFSRNIDKAETFFRLAVERDSQDITSRHNLSAALILKGEYARAQAECDHILQKYPGNGMAMNNKAIAFYYYGKKEDLDTTQKAIQLLHEANRLEPGNFEVLYNLASLKETRERLAGAKHFWEKYLSIAPKDGFYDFIYKKLKGKSPPTFVKKVRRPKLPEGIRMGGYISPVLEKWGSKNTGKYALGREEGKNGLLDMKVVVNGDIRVVGLDGMIEMAERKIPPGRTVSQMLGRFGTPTYIIRHTGGNFHVYKDRGFSVKEINGKIQSYTWFEKGFR